MALEVDLGSFWKEALATLTATAFDDAAASLSGHAGTETVLLLAGALGRLVSHFHGRIKKVKCLRNRGLMARDAETSGRKWLVNPS